MHVSALEKIFSVEAVSLTLNVGTGKGIGVLELINAFEDLNGVRIPCRVVGRRPGDVAACWADPARTAGVLGWQARRSLHEMCVDASKWPVNNQSGASSPGTNR